MKPDQLHVVAAITNPLQYRSRPALYRDFERRVLDAGAHLTTAEAAFGDRPHEVTRETTDHPRLTHIQVRTDQEIWHKESLLNIAIRRLPPAAKYIAWVDADVTFARPDWAAATVHALQHWAVVQMFSEAIDLGPRGEVLAKYTGFAYAWWHGHKPKHPHNYSASWHPGFAWACTRQAFELMGGLLDWSLLGSADSHMALGLIGKARASMRPDTRKGASAGYLTALDDWERKAGRLKQNLGWVDGTVLHHWHGKKADRGYLERWTGMIAHGFDPYRHLEREPSGLWRLSPDAPIGLRDHARKYFRSRNEDSVDL